MLAFVIRRLASAIPTLLVVVAVAFFMMRIAPGGPFTTDRNLIPEIEENLRAKYGLDDPLPVQFVSYLGDVLQGDFGPSFKYKDFTVSQLIADGAPVSFTLGASALLLAIGVGGVLGTFAALHQNKPGDYGVMAVAMAGICVPTFVTAPLLTLLFGVSLGWLPVAGWGNGDIRHLILPVVTLALPQIAVVSRLMRGSMIEVMRANFIRTARAKGLSSTEIVWRHALRAAALPLVSYVGPAAAALLTGSLVVEQIFGLPGVGRYFVIGALTRDYTLVMGVVILYATLIIALNMLADVAYGWLDPKVRLGR
ncbi:MAG: oligopeptide ABC transporter permease OppB [Pseudomonadota bacterium]